MPIYEYRCTDCGHTFSRLQCPSRLPEWKLSCVRVETECSSPANLRIVNIDPGYLDFYKLVLASAKFQGQKVYLGKGVYADPTLYYDKGWKSCDWSFPDFKSGRYDEFLTGVRRSYKNKMRNA